MGHLNFSPFRWLKRVSIARKLYLTVGIMTLLIAIELFTLWFSISTLSSVRAYVGGEGLWSKAQKDAVYHLRKYNKTHDEGDYQAFLEFMKVPLGDHEARKALLQQPPDIEKARAGFLEGRNHPHDIDGMINLVLRFHNISYIKKAITIWAEADPIIYQLLPIGEKLHTEINSPQFSQEKSDAIISKVDDINLQLTKLEDDFSYTLGEGSHWLESLVLRLVFIVALTVEISGLLLTITVSRGIAKGINEIVRVAKSIASGNFTTRAQIYSQDEIGILARSFNHMTNELEVNISARKEAERKQIEYDARMKGEQKFRIAIEAAPNCLIMVNREGKIVLLNKQTEKLFGYTHKELIGQSIEILVPERFRKHHPLSRNGFFETPEVRTMDNGRDLYGLHKNGYEFPVEIGLNPIETEDGLMILSSIIDITLRKKQEEQLKEARDKAEQSSKARQEFLSVMSHEIRTPLNAVIGTAHLLLEENPRADQLENLNMLKFSANNLLSLINNILDFSKIESGKIQLERTVFSFRSLIQHVMESFKHSAEEKQLKLRLNTDMDIPEIILGDPMRLTQVLTNLVHNAIKFTEKGEVCFTVQSLSKSREEIELLFEISDTGIGIEKNRLEEVFDSFTQAGPSITRQFGGTGLGLTICKKLIMLQGGELNVASELGRGSIFSFILKFSLPVHANEMNSSTHLFESSEDLSGIKVLVAEDNVTNQILAKKFLTRWGAVVDTAENGKMAAEKVCQDNYDVVLMDLQMPVMDGYESTKAIRTMGFPSEQLPIIAVSAYAMEADRMRVFQSDMNDYISKPIDPHQLKMKLLSVIQKTKAKPEEKMISSHQKVESMEELMELFSDDKDFVREYLEVMRKEFLQFPAKVMAVAREYNNSELRKIAHKIYPALKRIPGEKVSGLLSKLKIELGGPQKNQGEAELILAEIETACYEIAEELLILEAKFIGD